MVSWLHVYRKVNCRIGWIQENGAGAVYSLEARLENFFDDEGKMTEPESQRRDELWFELLGGALINCLPWLPPMTTVYTLPGTTFENKHKPPYGSYDDDNNRFLMSSGWKLELENVFSNNIEHRK
jgi:hypothetical protein